MRELKSLSPIELVSSRLKKFRGKPETPESTADNFIKMPGSLIYTGEREVEETQFDVIRFDADSFEELDELPQSIDDLNKKTWINITGLHDVDMIKNIGETFQIHPLALEDILHVHQRPKFEEFDDHLFIVAKMINAQNDQIHHQQVSFIVRKNLLISFQEKPEAVFNSVKNRLRNKSGKIRTRNTDYLAFALLDVIIDHYMKIIEDYGMEINDQEVRVIDKVDKQLLEEINISKREMNFLRKHTRPLKETIIAFHKSDNTLIEKRTRPYLSDLKDHIHHVTESIEIYRETINDNLQTYNTHISNKLNDTLKILTIFSVMFIPITFLAGIYGMNFEVIPELSNPRGYYNLLIAMCVIAVSMITYFKVKKWL